MKTHMRQIRVHWTNDQGDTQCVICPLIYCDTSTILARFTFPPGKHADLLKDLYKQQKDIYLESPESDNNIWILDKNSMEVKTVSTAITVFAERVISAPIDIQTPPAPINAGS